MRDVRDAGVRQAGAQLEHPDWGGDGGENPEEEQAACPNPSAVVRNPASG